MDWSNATSSSRERGLQPVKGEDVFYRLHERISRRHIDAPKPFLHVQKHLTSVRVVILLQGCSESPVCAFSVFLWQMMLYIPVLVDRAPLMDEFLAEAIPESLDNALAAIGDPDDSS